MADYEYALGTDPGDLQNLEDDLLIPPPHPATFTEWAGSYEAGTGMVYGDGWPSAKWQWDYLSAANVAALRAFCTGKSAQVYIRTLKVDVTTYANYSAIVIWPTMPDEAEWRMGRASVNFALVFTHLEEIV